MDNPHHFFQADLRPGDQGPTLSADQLQDWLKEKLGELLELAPEAIDIHQPFNEYGLSSVDAVGLSGELAELSGYALPPTITYDYPTIARLIRYLTNNQVPAQQIQPVQLPNEVLTTPSSPEEPIAIIGMACRFPGDANSPEAFWQLLRQGKDAVKEVPPTRWDLNAYYDPSPDAPGKMYTRHGCFIEDIDLFDADFFHLNPREATRMDPQQRLLMEVAWEAIENAGLATASLAGSQTAVFIGAMDNYAYGQLQAQQQDQSFINDPYFGIGIASSMLAGRLAYFFDLRGPTMMVDTACSSSLVALHLACQSLRHEESSLALVGGVNVVLLPEHMVNACKMGMLSADGRCKTFDAAADGFVMGEGCGVVLLKRLSQALADKNPILAIVRGSAVNQDGQSNGITAPNKLAQMAVLRQALTQARVEPGRVSYVEAHGSGTALGDPIEIAALETVYGEGRTPQQPLRVGTVKTNIGHLAGAAGMAGLFKAVLALQHKEIPPHLHLQQPNPHIVHLLHTITIPLELTPWQTEQETRMAGVSSFGWSGTNAHVVLEEAPCLETTDAALPSVVPHLFVLSASTRTALDQVTTNLSAFIQQHPDVSLTDIAYTLQTGRSALRHRRMLICSDREEAIAVLLAPPEHTFLESGTHKRSLVFLFPGVGEHYIDTARELYQTEPLFQEIIDRCCDLLKEYLALDLHDIMYPTATPDTQTRREGMDFRALLGRRETPDATGSGSFLQTTVAQPTIFMIDYALARLLETWGIHPQAMLGYSTGEYVAACLSGVFSLEDALLLVATRAQMIGDLPEGAMTAVALSEQKIHAYLTNEISLAAVNAPATCVLAGPVEALEHLETHLSGKDIAYRRLRTTHAFHSTMLATLQEALTRLLEKVQLHPPSIPYISNVTGTWITAQQALDPAYWASHMCQTVYFADGITQLFQDMDAIMLEVGPGQALSSFVKQHPLCTKEQAHLVLPILPARFEQQSDYAHLLTVIGKLWLAGTPINWSGLASAQQRHIVVPLPTYPFERQRYWIEPPGRLPASSVLPLTTTMDALKREELSHWFYLPAWKQTAPLSPLQQPVSDRQCWLVFLDSCTIGAQVIEYLKRYQQSIITVVPGPSFSKYHDTAYTLCPGKSTDYQTLFHELQRSGTVPHRIVHLWTVTSDKEEADHHPETLLDRGFYSLLALSQALGDIGQQTCHIYVISSSMHNVIGNEPVDPEKAVLMGPCRVLPQEHLTLGCSNIDLTLPEPGTRQEASLIRMLVAELTAPPTNTIVALRGNRRWLQTIEPLTLDNQQSSTLRKGGVYLITGGLGGIGLAMGAYLAQNVDARLVLTGQTGLPPRHEWDQILAQADNAAQGMARTLRGIQALEAQGTQILIMQADVANREQMQTVISQTLSMFGALNGVFHMAGVPGMGLMQLKTREQASKVLRPKVQGTRVLQQVLEGLDLDFLVLFSSITSTTGGGPGQADYAGANAFLDAYAQRYADKHGMTMAIDWGEWLWNAWDAGLAGYDAKTRTFLAEHRHQFGITFEEGADALLRALSSGLPQIIVSTQDFRTLAELSKTHTAFSMAPARHQRDLEVKHRRPELETSFIAPRNKLERDVAALWERQLGIEKIGINDNFFDLGGNSLLGVDLINQTRKTFHLLDLPAYILYETPTISLMAQHLTQTQSPGTSEEAESEIQERSEKRRGKHKQRADAINKEKGSL